MACGLTGLPTHRDIAGRRGSGFALWIDIDGLVWINDHAGFAAGDRAICDVARALRATLDVDGESLFRIAGDEFLALVADADEDSARELALRARDAIDALAIDYCRRDRPEADRLQVNSIMFPFAPDGVVERIGDDEVRGRLRDALADAVHREKLRSGFASGIVASARIDIEGCLIAQA